MLRPATILQPIALAAAASLACVSMAQNNSVSPEVNAPHEANLSGLSFHGVGGPSGASVSRLVFHGINQSHESTVGGVRFVGIDGANSTSVDQVSFIGWPPLEPLTLNEQLAFEGWGGDTDMVTADSLAFSGWGGGPQAWVTDGLAFEGWGDELEPMNTSQLAFTGLGPTVEIIENFDGAHHGWTANDGPDALLVSKGGALCVRDFQPGDVTLSLPERFLGDWGAGSGSLGFRVYYTAPIQWPAVVTIRSPHGQAVWRPSLNTWNDRGFEDVERSLDSIWWEYVGDFGLIRRTVEGVEISLDLKDGLAGDIEACIDDVVLTVQPLD